MNTEEKKLRYTFQQILSESLPLAQYKEAEIGLIKALGVNRGQFLHYIGGRSNPPMPRLIAAREFLQSLLNRKIDLEDLYEVIQN